MGTATMNLVKIKKRKYHEIEHESKVTHPFDNQQCEIPPDSYRDDL